jgi:hypothetical protein
MSERTARRLGLIGVLLVLLTIPVYFFDLFVFAPGSKPCEGPGSGNVVLAVFWAGVLLWVAGVVLSCIAISQRSSRFIGMGGVFIALLLGFMAFFGLFLLTAGECVPEPAAMLGLWLGIL